MESTTVNPEPTVPAKVPPVPVEVPAGGGDGPRAPAHDTAAAMTTARDAVVDASLSAIRDIARAGEKFSRDVKQAATPATVPVPPTGATAEATAGA